VLINFFITYSWIGDSRQFECIPHKRRITHRLVKMMEAEYRTIFVEKVILINITSQHFIFATNSFSLGL